MAYHLHCAVACNLEACMTAPNPDNAVHLPVTLDWLHITNVALTAVGMRPTSDTVRLGFRDLCWTLDTKEAADDAAARLVRAFPDAQVTVTSA